jgi:hypothetical protein
MDSYWMITYYTIYFCPFFKCFSAKKSKNMIEIQYNYISAIRHIVLLFVVTSRPRPPSARVLWQLHEISMVAYRCHKKIHKNFIYFFYLFFFLIFIFLNFIYIFFYFKNNFIWKQINVKTKWNDIKNKWKQNENYLWPIAAIRIFFGKVNWI